MSIAPPGTPASSSSPGSTDSTVVNRFEPRVSPDDKKVIEAIEAELKK